MQQVIKRIEILTSGNPVVAISIAVGVALAMVLVTFVIFINSSAYATVKQIQVGTQVARTLQGTDVDTRSPIKADDIEAYQHRLNTQLQSINDEVDFGPNAISDQTLGLNN